MFRKRHYENGSTYFLFTFSFVISSFTEHICVSLCQRSTLVVHRLSLFSISIIVVFEITIIRKYFSCNLLQLMTYMCVSVIWAPPNTSIAYKLHLVSIYLRFITSLFFRYGTYWSETILLFNCVSLDRFVSPRFAHQLLFQLEVCQLRTYVIVIIPR